MILRLFLSNQPLVLIFLIPIIALFQLLNVYFHFHQTFHEISLGLLGKTALFNDWWTGIPAAFVVGLNALQLNRLFNEHEFLDRNTYAPALFYVVLMSFSFSFYQFDALLIVHFCWVQVLRILYQMRPNEDNRKQAFNAAFFAGLGVVVLPQSAILLLFLSFALWALKSFFLKEWVMLLIGAAFPIFNGLMFWWFSGHSINLNVLKLTAESVQYETILYYSSGLAIFFLFILSIIGIRVRLIKSTVRFKKLNSALLWILVGAVVLGITDLIFYQQLDWFNLVFIPLSFFFTFAFIHKFWKEVATWFFYATFLLAVVKFFLHSQWLL
ncbi:MAG: hypothetical protein KA734_07995 [Fluviicola sp.]|nr:hypothetical protein [Fluviicola sp.]MBP6271278.1 hypothetical protein [Fluviicola sp.]